jgi:hypothetical protein
MVGEPSQVRSGQVRFITRPQSRTMRATRQLMPNRTCDATKAHRTRPGLPPSGWRRTSLPVAACQQARGLPSTGTLPVVRPGAAAPQATNGPWLLRVAGRSMATSGPESTSSWLALQVEPEPLAPSRQAGLMNRTAASAVHACARGLKRAVWRAGSEEPMFD